MSDSRLSRQEEDITGLEERGEETSARPLGLEDGKEGRGSRTNRLYTMPLLNDRPDARSSMFAHCVRSF